MNKMLDNLINSSMDIIVELMKYDKSPKTYIQIQNFISKLVIHETSPTPDEHNLLLYTYDKDVYDINIKILKHFNISYETKLSHKEGKETYQITLIRKDNKIIHV